LLVAKNPDAADDQGQQQDSAEIGATPLPPEIDVPPATAARRYALRNP